MFLFSYLNKLAHSGGREKDRYVQALKDEVQLLINMVSYILSSCAFSMLGWERQAIHNIYWWKCPLLLIVLPMQHSPFWIK